MSITCEACGYTNPADVEFCSACGSELSQPTAPPSPPMLELETPMPEPQSTTSDLDFSAPLAPTPPPVPMPTVESEPVTVVPPTPSPIPSDNQEAASVGIAKLVSRLPNAPVTEFLLDTPSCLVGRFDPDSGPVEVDLEGFPGDDTISRNHAEIYQEGGSWKIKDLGSTNGVFIKRVGENRYGARITNPQPIFPGDEVAIAKIRFLFQIG